MLPDRDTWNGARFVDGALGGHYESWFQRANHPERPLAFWIRYTIFAPIHRPDLAIGELWAVFSDGERQRVVALREEHPIETCSFSPRALDARIAGAHLDAATLQGTCRSSEHAITWSLGYRSPKAPLLLLPPVLYDAPLPKAKALVGSPLARFDGDLTVDGERIPIEGWVGSQNHNWGSAHTHEYAWGQVAGFDDAEDAFLEVSTARIAIGPFHTPPLTVLVLRVEGEELRLSSLHHALRARASYAPFRWTFESKTREARVSGTITAPEWSFVALPYLNPPGGTKTCLNSKLARCELEVERRGQTRKLKTADRAAFEMLSDAPPPLQLQSLISR